MNALGVLTIMSLLAPGPGPAAPFTIRENVEANNATTTTSTATPPTAAAAASTDVDVAAEISPSAPVPPQLIRVTEPNAEHSESKLPFTFTPSTELGPIHDESEDAGHHSVLQHGPSPLAPAESEPDNHDVDVYSSPVSLTAMAGASALRSRRPLLSPVRTAGLSAYASTPIKFEGETEHTGDDVHSHGVNGQDDHDHAVHDQDLHGHNLHHQDLHGQDHHSQALHDQDLHHQDLHGQDHHSQALHDQDLHHQDLHGQDHHSQALHGQDLHGHDVRGHELRGQDVRSHGIRVHDHGVRVHEIRGHNVRGHQVHGEDEKVVTALRGHYTLHSELPYNQHISLIAHHLGHDGGVASSGTPITEATDDSGADPDEHHTFPTISSLGDHHVYPTIGAFPYDNAKPTGPHVDTVTITHKPNHKPKELHHKKGWSKHWKTALRMFAGLAPLALLLAAIPPNVLIVNPTQTTVPMHMRGRIEDEALTDIASCRRVCEQVKAALSTVRIGGRESMPGFGDLLEAARSPKCAESLCAPDPPTALSTTTTTTTVTTHTAIPTTHPTPANGEPENKNRLVKKYVKAVKRRKNQQQQSDGV